MRRLRQRGWWVGPPAPAAATRQRRCGLLAGALQVQHSGWPSAAGGNGPYLAYLHLRELVLQLVARRIQYMVAQRDQHHV